METIKEDLSEYTSKMEKLFKLISNKDHNPNHGEDYESGQCEICEEVNCLACELFITSGGQCNWFLMKLFKQNYPGTNIFCLEGDSFGWLVGGIIFENKTFSYG